MSVQIREMRFDDYQSIDLLMRELHEAHVCGRPDIFAQMRHPFGTTKLMGILNDKNTLALVAQDGEEIAGFCIAALQINDDSPVKVSRPVAYLEDFIIASDYREKGIGRMLFERLETQAKARGMERIDLKVFAFNSGAKAFYESMGMKPQSYVMEKYL